MMSTEPKRYRAGQTIEASLSTEGLRLGAAYAFPNPLVMEGGQGTISFVFQPEGTAGSARSAPAPIRVRVFDLTGTPVASLSSSESPLAWDCRNEAGAMVASGTYLYIVESQGEAVEGKVVIVH